MNIAISSLRKLVIASTVAIIAVVAVATMLLAAPADAAKPTTGGGAAVGTPVQPVNLTVANRMPRSATLNWDAAAFAQTYNLELYTGSGTLITTIQSIKKNTYALDSTLLVSNKRYAYRVQGVNKNGVAGQFSTKKYFRTKPAQVKKLTIVDSSNSTAKLRWKKPRGKIKRYRVQVWNNGNLVRRMSKYKGLKKTWPMKTIRNLNSSQQYGFRVRAVYNKKNRGMWSDKVFLAPRT